MSKHGANGSSGWNSWRVRAFLVAVLTVGAVSLAQAHPLPLSGGTIHACVNTSSGTIKIIDAAATCASNELPVDWVANPANVAWGLTGNRDTNPSTNFLGTTDANPLVIKTNNAEAIRVTAGGNVGIGTGTMSPSAKLDVNGSINGSTLSEGGITLSGKYALVGGTNASGTWPISVNGSAASFTGSLAGDVTGPQGATVVAAVGGETAANVAAGTARANAATASNSANAIVRRDAAGNFAAGTITANLSGNATTATSAANFTGTLAGDVTGTQGSTTVARLQGRGVASTPPTDGQVLRYNASAGQWQPGTVPSGSASPSYTQGGSIGPALELPHKDAPLMSFAHLDMPTGTYLILAQMQFFNTANILLQDNSRDVTCTLAVPSSTANGGLAILGGPASEAHRLDLLGGGDHQNQVVPASWHTLITWNAETFGSLHLACKVQFSGGTDRSYVFTNQARLTAVPIGNITVQPGS